MVCKQRATSIAPWAIRGPARTKTSASSLSKAQTRRACRALRLAQPGRLGMASALLSPIKITSGCARTTNSGLTLGKGPRLPDTMFCRPRRSRVWPKKDDALAAYGPGLTSKYTRLPRALAGTCATAARMSASMVCTTALAVSTPSIFPSVPSTRTALA